MKIHLHEGVEALGLKHPVVIELARTPAEAKAAGMRESDHGRYRAQADGSHLIQLNLPSFTNGACPDCNETINNAFLHELRHAWQEEHGDAEGLTHEQIREEHFFELIAFGYRDSPHELDARQWAEKHDATVRVITDE